MTEITLVQVSSLNGHQQLFIITIINLKIDYVEFYSPKLNATQDFFVKACDWKFVEYGPNYRDIQNAGTGGGIERSENKAPLIVLIADDLEKAYEQVKSAGGEITKEIFEFPG